MENIFTNKEFIQEIIANIIVFIFQDDQLQILVQHIFEYFEYIIDFILDILKYYIILLLSTIFILIENKYMLDVNSTNTLNIDNITSMY